MTTVTTLMMRLKLQRTAAAAAAAVVAARAPSPQANERPMAEETGGNGDVSGARQEIKALAV